MSYNNFFTQENIDIYLKELAKEYKKISGKTISAELVIVGGASALINYGFRDKTYDIDAIITASSAMKDAINHVGDKYNLENGWLNSDFINTKSYSQKLLQFSQHYKTFSNLLEIRTVSAEYLIATKLMSGREYKNDLSDIIGILLEHKNKNSPISYEQISRAVEDLYGSWDNIPENSKIFIKETLSENNFEEALKKTIRNEAAAKSLLVQFNEKYSDILVDGNVNAILQNLLNNSQTQASEVKFSNTKIEQISSEKTQTLSSILKTANQKYTEQQNKPIQPNNIKHSDIEI
jgi:hypothetical protein